MVEASDVVCSASACRRFCFALDAGLTLLGQSVNYSSPPIP